MHTHVRHYSFMRFVHYNGNNNNNSQDGICGSKWLHCHVIRT